MVRRLRIVIWLLGAIAIIGALLVWRMPEVAAWQWRLDGGKPAMAAGPFALAMPLRWFDAYYVIADLGAGAYAIGEPHYAQCNFSYLIVGSQRALLFDSGPGLHDIRPVVASLTALPVLAIPSHLHFDHVGNLSRFENVGLPDLPALHKQTRDGKFHLGFYQYLGFVEGFHRPVFSVSQWIKPASDIDLGNIQLTLLSVPGHTPESVALLDRTSNRLFAGDFIYPSSIFAFLPGASLQDYRSSAHHVAALLNTTSTIYSAHGCDHLPAVDVPTMHQSDLEALAVALDKAATNMWSGGTGWYPREFPVNNRMTLLAKYPWMYP